MQRRRTPAAFVLFAAALSTCLCLPTIGADRQPTPKRSAELQAVLDRFDRVQDSIRTLSAELKMTTVNRLLKDPVVYQGHFYMNKPDAVRWEFNTPEEMRFVIADDVYLGYYPTQKRAERKDIRRWSEQLFRYFGLGQQSSELLKFYRIELAQPDAEMSGSYLLVMNPKKRRAAKRVEDVKFWVDRETLLPVKVEYLGTEGNTRTIEFRRMRTNVELASGLFTLELPADVEVSSGFHPFGGKPGS